MVNSKRIRLFLAISSLVLLAPTLRAGAEPVELRRKGSQVEVLLGGKPFTTYYFGAESPKPYLHPLRAAQGTIVTRGFPMRRNIPGESTDHPHHRAMFFAHGDVNGVDFWSEAQFEQTGPVTVKGKQYTSENLPNGRTVFRKLDEVKGGPDSGTLRATFDLVGPDGKALGSESQAYTFRGDDFRRTIDCEFIVRADRRVPVKMGDTKEGTFAIRLVKELEEPGGHMLNSSGAVGEKEIWGKRADWVDYSGAVKGEKLGVAIFDHSRNPKHPTYWHARGYGLFAVNPFGEHDFYNDKTRDGSITIPAGGSLTLRYRVLIHQGDATEAKVAEAYQNYAEGR